MFKYRHGKSFKLAQNRTSVTASQMLSPKTIFKLMRFSTKINRMEFDDFFPENFGSIYFKNFRGEVDLLDDFVGFWLRSFTGSSN